MKKFRIFILFLVLLAFFPNTNYASAAKVYTKKADVYNVIKKNLMARKGEFTIKMNTKVMKAIKNDGEIFDSVASIDSKNTAKDGDYLRLSVTKWATTWVWTGNSVTLTFNAYYSTTAKQEKELDTKIANIIKRLKLTNKSDYEKVKAIHDYIIKNTSYDRNLENYSAYDALIGKSAVCQGYTLAAYRLFTAAGLESRIITGYAGGAPHAWNIVKVDGQWYNIDVTWDDPITMTGTDVLTYDYFLKSDEDFTDHIRDTRYTSKAFLKKYPIAKTSYLME
jgi:ribosomal protein L28